MIFIDRTKTSIPPVLSNTSLAKFNEIQQAEDHFILHGNHTEFNFKVYKDPSVKEQLLLLFEGKCAYCESSINASQPGDIEHFRPKAKVKKQNDPTDYIGYYWLAAEWHNLYLSCRNCNSPIKQKTQYKPLETIGKANYFPLDNDNFYIDSKNQSILVEEPYRLLIDPCRDKPEKYLLFDVANGNILPLRKTGFANRKALKTIEILGLHRMPLVHNRKKTMLEITKLIFRIRDIAEALQETKSKKSKNLLESILIDEIGTLKSRISEKSEYSAAAKHVFHQQKKQISDLL